LPANRPLKSCWSISLASNGNNFERRPDFDGPEQRVSFGTSGHRGSSLRGSFKEAHILAIPQAICDYRRLQGVDGPLFMEKDTHGLSGPAQRTAFEVLAANHVNVVIQQNEGVLPSRAKRRDDRSGPVGSVDLDPTEAPTSFFRGADREDRGW
jgi:phosphoglucomutase